MKDVADISLMTILERASLALGIALVLLLALGARSRRTGAIAAAIYAAVVVAATAALADVVWGGSHNASLLAALIGVPTLAVAATIGRDWNPPAQTFMGTLVVTCATFLAFAAWYSLGRLDHPVDAAGSVVLLALETLAVVLLLTGTHEALNVGGRVRWRRRTYEAHPPLAAPFVSIHVPVHNEPPELVLETLRSLNRLAYNDYEVLVIDNNTTDERLWQPVERYCREAGFRFFHLDNWPGFKAGALNYALRETDGRAEIVAVVDADFVVEPDFLSRTVGYFDEPRVGFVQTAQAFRSSIDRGYFRRLALSYLSFDSIQMPSRNERDAIIFAGTMGLLRREALVDAGGWSEWCVTEDAELSLRVLARGYHSVFVERAFGHGVMPLTFAGLKSQRFRWCFGGIQILRRYWKLIVFGRGVAPDGTRLRLTLAQRYEYLVGQLQWFQALLMMMFALVLAIGIVLLVAGLEPSLRPMTGLFVAVPALLVVTGVVKSMWALRARQRIGVGDAAVIMGIWFSLNWAVALGCLHGLARGEGVFLRTPKFKERQSLRQAFGATRAEAPLALGATIAAAVAAAAGRGGDHVFLAALATWSALVFWSAPITAFFAARAQLDSPALIKRRRLEGDDLRRPLYARRSAHAVAGVAAVVLVVLTASSVTMVPGGTSFGDLFGAPRRESASGIATPVVTGSGGSSERYLRPRPAPDGIATTSQRTAPTARSGRVAAAASGGSPATPTTDTAEGGPAPSAAPTAPSETAAPDAPPEGSEASGTAPVPDEASEWVASPPDGDRGDAYREEAPAPAEPGGGTTRPSPSPPPSPARPSPSPRP